MSSETPTLLPAELVEQITARKREFQIRYADSTFLVVNIGGDRKMLEVGLSTLTSDAANVGALAFHTAISVHGSTRGKRQSVTDLRERLARAPHFILPLGKRGKDTTYADRVSVGRALNKDVVLRDHSVSKFHAWFEVERGQWTVSDAGSTNGTLLNGSKLTAKESFPVSSGDLLRFGSIECTLCAASLLADAVQGR
ncbi:MAG TPA: FHA domain-containing protein [Polyangiales bacterium]|nr:FHA domain-containing protein [Polyangiales bacterium]